VYTGHHRKRDKQFFIALGICAIVAAGPIYFLAQVEFSNAFVVAVWDFILFVLAFWAFMLIPRIEDWLHTYSARGNDRVVYRGSRVSRLR
jgi:predicted membrane channel-forming protein YqfA (hemolysin III family)